MYGAKWSVLIPFLVDKDRVVVRVCVFAIPIMRRCEVEGREKMETRETVVVAMWSSSSRTRMLKFVMRK